VYKQTHVLSKTGVRPSRRDATNAKGVTLECGSDSSRRATVKRSFGRV
jgi:hypothetical protein